MIGAFDFQGRNLAIIGPKSPSVSAHISSICDAKEIPYIDTYMDIEAKTSNVNLYPTQDTLSKLLIETVNRSEWIDFTILYEAPFYVKRIAPILEEKSFKGIITVQPLQVGSSFRNVLKKVKDMGSRSINIIIECSIEHLTEILEQVNQIQYFREKKRRRRSKNCLINDCLYRLSKLDFSHQIAISL